MFAFVRWTSIRGFLGVRWQIIGVVRQLSVDQSHQPTSLATVTWLLPENSTDCQSIIP